MTGVAGRLRILGMGVVAALHAGCAPARLETCGDRACLEAVVRGTDEAHVPALLDAVRALPDPIVQSLAVEAVFHVHPEAAKTLCADLPPGPAAKRCEEYSTRPHLYQVDPADPTAGPNGVGTAFHVLALDGAAVRSPWSVAGPRLHPCPSDAPASICQVDAARAAAAGARMHDAASACNAIEEEKWRYECYFQASETAFVARRVGTPGRAAELCLGAGWYVDRCLGHLAVELAHTAPSAAWEVPRNWNALNLAALEVQGVLTPHGDGLAERWVHLMWAEAVAVAYGDLDHPTGLPLDMVEVRAVPHVRAMVAARAWAVEGPQRSRTLDGWVDRLMSLLDARQPDPTSHPVKVQETSLGAPWNRDLPGEEALAWVPYRGGLNRRVVSPDPRTDVTICLLEAVARAPGEGQATLLRAGLAHPDPLVRWTAARLAPLVLGDDVVGASGEADPFVLGRLEAARRR